MAKEIARHQTMLKGLVGIALISIGVSVARESQRSTFPDIILIFFISFKICMVHSRVYNPRSGCLHWVSSIYPILGRCHQR